MLGRAPGIVVRVSLLLGACAALAGCANPYRKLRSHYAPDRADAAIHLAQRGDPQAVPALVDLLEDEDPAVRMYGILALERLTGETFGYQYYARPQQRRQAVERWREALRQGRVVARPGSSALRRDNPDVALVATP